MYDCNITFKINILIFCEIKEIIINKIQCFGFDLGWSVLNDVNSKPKTIEVGID